MFGVSSGEVVLIIIVAVLLFGPKKLPAAAKTAGRFIANLRNATADLKKNIEDEIGIKELSELNPRRIADKIVAGEDISDIHPGRYGKGPSQEFEDPYKEEKKESSKEPVGSKGKIENVPESAKMKKAAVSRNGGILSAKDGKNKSKSLADGDKKRMPGSKRGKRESKPAVKRNED